MLLFVQVLGEQLVVCKSTSFSADSSYSIKSQPEQTRLASSLEAQLITSAIDGSGESDSGVVPDGYRDFFADYVFYQCIDSIILEQIDKELNTAKIWFMLASILRINAYDAFSTINPVETVISNFIYEDYKVIPSMKHEVPEIQESYAGAWVLPVNKSIVRYVGGLDFASLYPSIIRQFGVSPEKFLFKDTKVIGKNPDGTDKTVVGDYVPKEDEIKMKSGAVYKKGPAILPNILTHYYNLRKQAKNDRKDVDTELAYYEKILEERETGVNLS